MSISEFAGCCKASIIYGFGGGHVDEDDKVNPLGYLSRASKKETLDYLEVQVNRLRRAGKQVLFACPTNHQPEAIEALLEFGFYSVDEKEINSICGVVCAEYDEDGNRVDIDHYMVPMFYLIPKK